MAGRDRWRTSTQSACGSCSRSQSLIRQSPLSCLMPTVCSNCGCAECTRSLLSRLHGRNLALCQHFQEGTVFERAPVPPAQFPSSRSSKAELAGAAAAAAALQGRSGVAEASAAAAPPAAGPSGAELLLVWSLPGTDGRPAAIGAHHIHGLQPKARAPDTCIGCALRVPNR